MRYFSIILCTIAVIASCSPTPKKKGNVTISGNIKGLKKGTLYLQKVQDTTLVTVDSLVLNGSADFLFYTQVIEPEIHYLYLDKDDGTAYNDRIDFFAEPGDITIYTSVNDFENDVVISGGVNQTKLTEFKQMNVQFSVQNLRLLKEDHEARKQNDQERLLRNEKEYQSLLRRKYLYTINFAITNKEFAVAPYITLHEVMDANTKYLDSLANSLTPQIKKSKYGQQFIQQLQKQKTDLIAKE